MPVCAASAATLQLTTFRFARRPATITIHSGDESPHSTASYLEPDSPSVGGVDEYQSHDSDDKEEEEVLHPSDSASTSNDISPPPLRATRARRILHRVVPPPTQDQPPVHTRAPMPPHKVDAPEDYGPYGQAYGATHAHRGGFYGSERAQHTSYPQHQHGLYLGNYPGGNQMINYGGYAASPFTNMSNVPNGSSYFGGEPRHSANVYDMMPYQQPGFFATPQYALPGHLQQYQLSTTHPHQLVPAPAPAPAPAPVPPATEAPAKTPTPAPKEPPPDLEKIKLEAQLAAFKAVEDKARAAEEQREREAQIRKEAEETFQRRAEELKKAQEEAQKEIQRARVEAERAARERIEAERKAEEERQKQQAEAMQRAEQNARLKFEAEMKAAEAQRKKEEEDRIRAEEAAHIRLEAAIKAKDEANAAAAKQAAEEAERIKMLQEDAKRRAELDTLKRIEDEKEAAKKAAAAADAAKAEQEALMLRIREETKASLEEAAKKTVQPPIKFKDAGMEELIKQAFLQVDVLGPLVRQGHYDLVGPNGEIILPTVWDKVVQPDWTITMTMWPVEKSPPLAPKVAAGRRHTHRGAETVPPPPDWPKSAGRRSVPLHPNIDIVNVAEPAPKRSKSTSKHKLRNPAMIGFLAGFQSKKK
ncbi:hypothetical protein E4U13_002179 [Claviceps humidiphila]|uniref:Ubiquitin-like domain-containing protein n=1 Tax=Claviceps humidiphila TaxID=1294629 RepID=A0A9P7Q0D9_9HYPO|nr:hypothetical protein E4U13_002179 [Claviceps humidiphila]